MVEVVAERVEPQNVSLYPTDWQIVDSADVGQAGRSATLRRIIREWATMRLTDSRTQYVVDTRCTHCAETDR